jgi:hypothetical protein
LPWRTALMAAGMPRARCAWSLQSYVRLTGEI